MTLTDFDYLIEMGSAVDTLLRKCLQQADTSRPILIGPSADGAESKEDKMHSSDLSSETHGSMNRDRIELTLEAMRTYLWILADKSLDEPTRAKISPSDVVQETLLEVFKGFGDFKGNTPVAFRSWVRKILINNARNARRHFRMQIRDVALEVPQVPPNLKSPTKTPSSLVASKEQFDRLERALLRLDEEQREVIELRSLFRLSFEEVGRRMGRSPDAARKFWLRAIRKLKHEMSPRMIERPSR